MLNTENHKNAHLQLSDFAAKYYDEYLAHPEIEEVTKFEENIIRRRKLDYCKKDIAIELGCGTGKKSLLINEIYDKVYAYDISKNMLEVAASLAPNKNITFELIDIDKQYELIQHHFSFLFAGFGFASFLTQIRMTISHFSKFMKKGGTAYFSFYNSAYKKAEKKYSLSSSSTIANDYIRVRINTRVFNIRANKYCLAEVKNLFSSDSSLELLSLETYPNQISINNRQDFLESENKEGKYIGALVQKREF